MKISDERMLVQKTFGELKCGEIFVIASNLNNICMKIANVIPVGDTTKVNTVFLSSYVPN